MNSSQKKLNDSSEKDYAESAVLACLVGEEMLSRLEWVKLDPKVIVDVSHGTEYFAGKLRERFAQARVVSVDRLNPIGKSSCEQGKKGLGLGTDLSLPLEDHSVDFLFANLVLPWCPDVEAVFREWARVLRPGGLLMFSSLGPDTLLTLRETLRDYTLPDLTDMHVHGDALTKMRFADPVLDVDYFTLKYREWPALVRELQVTGMLSPDMPCEIIEAMGNSISKESLLTEYEVVFGQAFGAEISFEQPVDDDGLVRIPLSHLRGRGLRE